MPTIAIGSSSPVTAAGAGAATAAAAPSSSVAQVAGEGVRGRVVEDERSAGRRRPVAALSRLRSSTAVSESKPRSWKARSGSIGLRRRVRRAPWRPASRTRSSDVRSCSAADQAGQPSGPGRAHRWRRGRPRAGRAPGAAAAAGSDPAAACVRSVARSNLVGSSVGWAVGERRVEQRQPLLGRTARRCRRGPSGPGRRRPGGRSCRRRAAHSPQASEVAAAAGARRCAARASRKALAAA